MLSSTKSEPEISVIIVSFRARDKLTKCLDSLMKECHEDFPIQIIVVNNDPEDTTLASLLDNYQDLELINNSGNLGFAHGCNTGALAARSKTLLFLNPDTQVQPKALSQMLTEFKKLPSFSILGCSKTNAKGRPERTNRFFPSALTISGVGKMIHRQLNKKKNKEDFDSRNILVFPDWISGSVVMMQHQNFAELKGWDTRYWMYSEDIDLCKRATQMGGLVAILQSTSITHEHGGSSRINPEITSLTKTEVQISHHVYVSLQERGLKAVFMHCQYIFLHLLSNLVWALVSLLKASSPAAVAKRLTLKKLLGYYVSALHKRTWVSPRAVGVENRFS